MLCLARDYISENRYCEITSEYRIGMERLAIVTFLFSNVLSRPIRQESLLQPSPWSRERCSVSRLTLYLNKSPEFV